MISETGKSFPSWTPTEIISAYYEKGIKLLFEWQLAVLEFAEANDRNIVYSAPTSAGKSIVSELIALRQALQGRKVLFLLPYISMAKEKLRFLQRAWRRVDVQVAAFVGAQSAPSREWMGAVCTTEKANSLINHAIVDGQMEEIGLIVVDELHMVYDSSRGAVLESLCAKILLWNSCNPSSVIRIIGMSATLENMEEVGDWLGAKVISSQYRPIELQERVCCGGQISDLRTGAFIRDVPKRFIVPDDPECVIGLAAEGIFFRKLVLVFCSSKAEVEKVALELAKVLDEIYRSNEVIAGRLNRAALRSIRANLERSAGTVDAILAQTLPRGVAFHHAGLTAEERECIEDGFRSGVIVVLVATSTLSSGVNLPASRVVIKAQIRGPAAITATTYKQMIGRSGRLGQVETGESILAVRQSEKQETLRLIQSAPQPSGNLIRDHTKLLLECICNGLTTTMEELKAVYQLTLVKSLRSVEESVCDLAVNRFIVVEEGSSLSPTQLGKAALASALPPDAALFVFADLKQATKSIALDTELHMLYLVTPTNISIWQGCDWNHLHGIFSKLSAEEKRVAKLAKLSNLEPSASSRKFFDFHHLTNPRLSGIECSKNESKESFEVGANDRFLMSRLRGLSVSANDRNYQLHLRFFSALALFDVINEKPIEEVARRFKISRGTLQTLQQQSATYAAMVVAFCARLGWTYLCDLLKGFATRLAFGVRRELTELVSIAGVDASRARIFHEHDITSMVQLSNCATKRIAEVLSLAVPFSNSSGSDGLNEWLSGEAPIRLEEAATLLKERAYDAVKDHLRSLGLSIDCIRNASSDEAESNVPPQQSEPAVRERDSGFSEEPEANTVTADTFNGPVAVDQTASDNFTASSAADTINASSMEEESIDLFSESMEELAISERSIMTAVHPQQCVGDGDGEVDDLESSLLKISLVRDKENETEDSFDEPVIPKPASALTTSSPNVFRGSTRSKDCGALSPLVEWNSGGFAWSQHPSIKRARQPVLVKSPATASPLTKSSRVDRHLPSARYSEFKIIDVCRSVLDWNEFIQRSKHWSKVGVALATEHRRASPCTVDGISLCSSDGTPCYIPLTEEYFPGNDEEEAMCPSSTPSHSVTLGERRTTVSSILQRSELIFINALNDSHQLRKLFRMEDLRLKCVSHMAFLGHLRKGDRVLSLSEIADRFQWSFDAAKLLRMNSRISSAVRSCLALRLETLLAPLVVSRSSAKSFQLETRSLQAVNTMCMGGFAFDRALCSSLTKKLKVHMEILENECYSIIGHQFNLDSSLQVSEVLFSRLKLTYPSGSSTKRHLSTNKNVLEQMRAQHPIIEKILLYRRYKHAITQCLAPMERFVDSDGNVRSHCDMNTSTGRILCVEPNVQTVPKDELIDGIGLRHLFIAQPGKVLISADYRQLELRVLAHLSGDPALIKIFEDGQDVFEDMASRLKISRDTAKRLCYGIIYGIGAKTLSEVVRKSTDEANRLIKDFYQTFPKVRTFINLTRERALKDGFVSTVLGKRRVTCNARGRQEDLAKDDRNSVNYIIQGTASEVFKRAIVALDEGRSGATRIVMTLHDEIVIECESENEEEVKSWMRSKMQQVFPEFLVPLPVKIRSGPSWGALS